MEKNKVYVMPHKRGWNLLRWLWLSMNLFVTVKFHDVQGEINSAPPEGRTITLLPGTYLFYKTMDVRRDNISLVGR